MASVTTLRPPAGRMDSPSSFAALHSLPRSHTFPISPSLGSSLGNIRSDSPQSLKGGAVVATQALSQNHARLHKKSQARPKLDTRRVSPPLSSDEGSFYTTSESTGAWTTSKDKLRQNIRKLSLQREDLEEPQPQIDLSKTAEENEERSGLGISTPVLNSGSFPDSRVRRHGRTASHTSLQSSGSWKPSVPFTLPTHSSSRADSPLCRLDSAADSSSGSDLEDDAISTALTSPITTTASSRPFLPTFPSTSSAATSQTPAYQSRTDLSPGNVSISSRTTRPRRSTNQSIEACTSATSRSRTSLDRAFSFVSRTRSKDSATSTTYAGSVASPVVPQTSRAASVHAARQAFAERELKEEKRFEQVQRRQERLREVREDWRRRKSDAASAPMATTMRAGGGKARRDRKQEKERAQSVVSMPADFQRPAIGAARRSFHGFEYGEMPYASQTPTSEPPAPGFATAAAVGAVDKKMQQRSMSLPAITGLAPRKRSLVKTQYVRTVAWIRVRLLRLGEGRK